MRFDSTRSHRGQWSVSTLIDGHVRACAIGRVMVGMPVVRCHSMPKRFESGSEAVDNQHWILREGASFQRTC